MIGRQRRALAGAGDFRRQHWFVRLDGAEHDAAAAGQQFLNGLEAAARQRAFGPRNFAQRRCVEFIAEPQRLGCHNQRLRRGRLALGLRFQTLHARFGLAVKPCLRDENRHQAENGRHGDHDESAFAHGLPSTNAYDFVAATIAAQRVFNW